MFNLARALTKILQQSRIESASFKCVSKVLGTASLNVGKRPHYHIAIPLCTMAPTSFTLLDGGTSTELIRLGHGEIQPYQGSQPLWSAMLLHTAPNDVKTAHKNFVEAGADIVVTISYQASIGGFAEQYNFSEDEAIALMKKSVELAKQACKEVHEEKGTALARVAGSVGAYGATLCDGSEYTGTYVETMTIEELQTWHRPRIEALLSAGADLLAIETIPSWREAQAVVQLLEKDFPQAQAYVTFSCPNGSETCHNEPIEEAVMNIQGYKNVVAVGINCTYPQYITPLLKCIQGQTIEKPLIVKPNSGEPYIAGQGWIEGENVTSVPGYVEEWLENGASWIGGCCRVTPDEIREIREKLDKLKK